MVASISGVVLACIILCIDILYKGYLYYNHYNYIVCTTNITLMNTQKYTSKINKGNSNNNSLRCGIPYQIVQLLDLSDKDTLKWITSASDDGSVVVTVEKLEL